jgi:hypothetical protein
MRTAFYEIQEFLTDYFGSVDWQNIILALKIISVIFSCLLLVAIVLLIARIKEDLDRFMGTVSERTMAAGLPGKKMDSQWHTIFEKLESDNESDYKLAVIEADKILDGLLKDRGYYGEDMGERLKQANSEKLPNLDELWQAHKVRNRIAHETDFQLNQSQARRAVEIYRRAFQDLEQM